LILGGVVGGGRLGWGVESSVCALVQITKNQEVFLRKPLMGVQLIEQQYSMCTDLSRLDSFRLPKFPPHHSA